MSGLPIVLGTVLHQHGEQCHETFAMHSGRRIDTEEHVITCLLLIAGLRVPERIRVLNNLDQTNEKIQPA